MRRLLVVLLLVGCGGDDSSVHHPPDAPRGEGNPLQSGIGFVTTIEGAAFASGAFFASTVEYPANCAPTTVGDCLVFSCPTATTTTAAKSAGTVAIAGGTGGQTYELTKSATNTYTFPQTNGVGAMFPAGTSVKFSGTGDEVPAFSSMVTMPDRLQLDAPAGGETQSRASDMSIKWSNAATANTIVFALSAGNPVSAYVTCVFSSSGASDSGVIPSSALMALPAGGAVLSTAAYATTDVTAGSFEFKLYAGASLYNSTHTAGAGGSVTLQ